MNKLTYLLLSVCLCTNLLAKQLEELLPTNTLFCAKVQNIAELKSLKTNNPFTELSNNPDLQLYYNWISGEMNLTELPLFMEKMQEELKLEEKDLTELFQGQALMAVSITDINTFLSAISNQQNPSQSIEATLILEHPGKRKEIIALIENQIKENEDNPNITISQEKIHGATVYSKSQQIEGTEDFDVYLAINDSKLIFSVGKQALIQSLEKDMELIPNDSLLQNENYQKVLSKCPQNDILFYINIEPIAQIATSTIRTSLTPAEDEAPNPMLPNADMILRSLSLESITSIYASASLSSEDIVLKSGLFYKEKSGILKLLQYQNTTFEKPLFIPENATQLAMLNFSIPGFVQELEQIIFQAYPMANMMYQGYLMQLNSQSGIDLRNSLIQSIGDQIYIYGVGIDENVVALELKDSEQFEAVFNKILEFSGQSVMRNSSIYMDETVYTLANEYTTEDFCNSYTIIGNRLLFGIGKSNILNSVIAQIKDPNKSMLDSPKYKNIWKQLKTEDVCAIQITKFDSYINQVLKLVGQNIAMEKAMEAAMQEGDELQEMPPPPPAPEINLDWLIVGESYIDSDGIHSTTKLLKHL